MPCSSCTSTKFSGPARPWTRFFGFFVSILLIVSLTTACDDDPVSDLPDPTDVTITIDPAFTVDPDPAAIGETVTLDASDTEVSGSSSVGLEWTLDGPEESEAELDDPTSPVTTFVPDIAGEYVVTLEVTAGEESDTAEATVEALAIQYVEGTIDEDEVWNPDLLYIVTGPVTMNGQLMIEPGTRIEFEQNTWLQITSAGSIIADGTQEEPILMTGREESRGFWSGLVINGSQSTTNRLDHLTVEYGGNDQGVGSASLAVVNGARIQVTNSTFRQSEGVGLHLMGSSSRFPDSAGNTYTENGQSAAATQASLLHYLDDGSDYSGNNTDRVTVVSETVNSGDHVWQAINAWYEMDGQTRVEDVDLTIEAGAEFRFTADSDLIFRGDGTFLVDGNRDAEVLFTGTEQDPGWWNGIQLSGAPNPDNLMRHAIVEYGGGGNMYNFSTQDAFANLLIGGRTSTAQARLSVQNSTFRHSADYGLKISGRGGESHMPDAGSNTYIENAGGAAYTNANSMHYFAGSSEFTGNSDDHVAIVSISQNRTVTGSEKTWSAINVPYRFSGQEVRPTGVEIIIEPGAQFEFTSDHGISFREDSIINAVGTEGDPIIFTATSEIEGWWSGIQISSLSPENRIEHAHFFYGGSDNGFGNWSTQNDFANLLVGGRTDSHAGRLHAENNLFANSEGYGIKVTADSDINSDVCDVNDFDTNGEGDCLIK